MPSVRFSRRDDPLRPARHSPSSESWTVAVEADCRKVQGVKAVVPIRQIFGRAIRRLPWLDADSAWSDGALSLNGNDSKFATVCRQQNRSGSVRLRSPDSPPGTNGFAVLILMLFTDLCHRQSIGPNAFIHNTFGVFVRPSSTSRSRYVGHTSHDCTDDAYPSATSTGSPLSDQSQGSGGSIRRSTDRFDRTASTLAHWIA